MKPDSMTEAEWYHTPSGMLNRARRQVADLMEANEQLTSRLVKAESVIENGIPKEDELIALTARLAAAEKAAVELWNEATDDYWFADNHAGFLAKHPWIGVAAKGGRDGN